MSSIPSVRLTEIALVGMRFHVCVGILPHEREIPQPLEVDLVVRHVSTEHGPLDYRDLFEMTRTTIDSDARTYLELLAEALAQRVLAVRDVTWCRVAVRKPHVALGGPLDHVQIAVERERA